MSQFRPGLIVEATSVCDRACAGCYAPNVVSNQDMRQLYRDQPDLFLNPNAARKALARFPDKSLSIISIRGGEPSRHPELVSLIEACAGKSDLVVVETHGRWMLSPVVKDYKELLSALTKFSAAVKISFDRMHGLTVDQLKTITQLLDWNKIQFFIAITEDNITDFTASRQLCSWLPDRQVILQKKAKTAGHLIRPQCGVLATDGDIRGELSSRETFRTVEEVAL